MLRRGSQTRVSLEEAGYAIVEWLDKPHLHQWIDDWCMVSGEEWRGTVVLRAGDGVLELWSLCDDHAGYTIEIEGKGYEFVREFVEEDRQENQ
jgi:hypothetical protein